MDFWEKIDRLVRMRGKSKQEASVDARLPATSLSNYISKRQLPRVDIGVRIANSLGVGIEWLLDDRSEWPPPKSDAKPTAAQLSDNELMLEVARRHRLQVVGVVDGLDQAEKIDWSNIEQLVDAAVAGGGEILRAFEVVRTILMWWQVRSHYDPDEFAWINHDLMPGADRDPIDVNPDKVDERVSNLLKVESFRVVAEWMIETGKAPSPFPSFKNRRILPLVLPDLLSEAEKKLPARTRLVMYSERLKEHRKSVAKNKEDRAHRTRTGRPGSA